MRKAWERRFIVLLTLALAAGIVSLTGCLTTSNDPAPTGPESSTTAQEHGIQALVGMGFKRDRIQPLGEGFLVEGDMFIKAKDLADQQQLAKSGPLAKAAHRGIQPVSDPPPNTLKLAIDNSMADWAIYVHQAVNNWNSLNTRLHIEVVSWGRQYTTIYAGSDPGCPAELKIVGPLNTGRANLGVNGHPGAAICINKEGEGMDIPGVRVNAITHEIGHTLGFEHTDDTQEPLIPGTPVQEERSIMNSLSDNYSTGNLTTGDRLAAEIWYPSVKPLGRCDLDSDGRDDLVAWRPKDGNWMILASSTGLRSGHAIQWGQIGDVPMAGMDLDGDHLSDFVVWRPANGTWYAKLSNGRTRSIQWGQLGDIPIGGHDMDGDGKSDLVVWRWSEGKFFVLTSRSDYTAGYWYGWGQAGDIPVGGIDADKDGKDDWVVWRPSEGIWYVELSSSGFTTSTWYGWGQPGDIPLGGTDIDLDNHDDLTIWRPFDGTLYARGSNGNYFSYASIRTGGEGDVPLTGSYIDGDNLLDPVSWRPVPFNGFEGFFFVKESSTGFTTTRSYAWPPQ